MTGWWFFATHLKNMKVNGKDYMIIPTIGENKFHVPNHQPGYVTNYRRLFFAAPDFIPTALLGEWPL
jgi:hypothetical protein